MGLIDKTPEHRMASVRDVDRWHQNLPGNSKIVKEAKEGIDKGVSKRKGVCIKLCLDGSGLTL